MKKCGYYIYWYNPVIAKTGIVIKTTTSEERAIELFYRDYSKDYIIKSIHN